MKSKFIALVLAASLTTIVFSGCGESTEEGSVSAPDSGKYTTITTMLDEGNYEGAIAQIVGMAAEARAKDAASEDSPEARIRTVLEGKTFTDVTGDYQMALSAAGAATLNGTPLSWEVASWDEDALQGSLGYSEDGNGFSSLDLLCINDCYALRIFLDDEVRYLTEEGELHSATITDDNWSDFFDTQDYGYTASDSFGELNGIFQGTECVLKDPYKTGFITGQVSLSIRYSDMSLVTLVYNIKTGEFHVEDFTGDATGYYVDKNEQRTVIYDFTDWDLTNDHGEDGTVYPMSISDTGGWYFNKDTELGYESFDGEIATRNGYTFKNVEVQHATGTIYWLSK